jgi:hypothetical protein
MLEHGAPLDKSAHIITDPFSSLSQIPCQAGFEKLGTQLHWPNAAHLRPGAGCGVAIFFLR